MMHGASPAYRVMHGASPRDRYSDKSENVAQSEGQFISRFVLPNTHAAQSIRKNCTPFLAVASGWLLTHGQIRHVTKMV
jgi:hypothetical protein